MFFHVSISCFVFHFVLCFSACFSFSLFFIFLFFDCFYMFFLLLSFFFHAFHFYMFLGREGKDGGCLADEVQNVTDKWRQFSFLTPAYFTLDEIASERALDDFERIKANTLDASLGRTSPPWSAPLELDRMMSHPDRDIDESRAGIGNDKTPIEAKEFERWFRQLLYTVRKENQAPWIWHRCYTIPLGKQETRQAHRL